MTADAQTVSIASTATPETLPKEPPRLSVVSANESKKGAYPPPAALPTQQAPHSIRFDFNYGARVNLPQGTSWRIRLSDTETGNLLFDNSNTGAVVASAKRYYIAFKIEVWADDKLVFDHTYSAAGRKVLVQFPVGTLGDTMGWFPYAVRFQEQHGCEMICSMSGLIIPLFKDSYPHIRFVTPEEVVDLKIAEEVYASYMIGLFFDDKDSIFQPVDFRHVGLHRTAGHILGVDPTEKPPMVTIPDDARPIPEPYVCIAVQASSQCKYWNNPNGWREVVDFLKAAGYRVICIDQKPMHGTGLVWNHIPHGAEDQTGNRPLVQRARWLKHAEAFIGLSSGLAWVAWAVGVPVVMISGFTLADNEFHTPYRVINYHACNGCWNDPKERFDHKDFLWCPRHANTPRQFECTKLITSKHVISVFSRIPAVATVDNPVSSRSET